MPAHRHHRIRFFRYQIETTGQDCSRQAQVTFRMHHQEELARIVRCRNIFRRLYFFVWSIIDNQVIFNVIGINDHHFEAGQTILQHHRAVTLQLTLFIRRQTKRFQIVKTLWENDIFILFRSVNNQVELRVCVKAESSSESRQ